MDLKPIVARLAADCDLRNRLVRCVPTALDNFFVSGGEILTEEELNAQKAFTYFLDGIDFVAGQVAKV
ncbi:MAG: hypothetical protein NTW06_04290 [Candidatus Falkowbacteria bacterium]|nr:hypothetical protein [Candidatus Falkowbacteria bacterium]